MYLCMCVRVCRNPVGRTGMIGRGLLGRWGPNHAADPIVTRLVSSLCYTHQWCHSRPKWLAGSMLGSLSCLMQRHAFDPPLGKNFPVEGTFSWS